jgi:hypothetical protein
MNASRTPLRDRIAARRGIPIQRPVEPTPQPKAEPWRAPWLARIAPRDDTGRLLS